MPGARRLIAHLQAQATEYTLRPLDARGMSCRSWQVTGPMVTTSNAALVVDRQVDGQRVMLPR